MCLSYIIMFIINYFFLILMALNPQTQKTEITLKHDYNANDSWHPKNKDLIVLYVVYSETSTF